ncbi:hypothetical protein GJAV_G00109950 [Gymnothorax javanicus]|nr:hypothetical protein GJAV_G00109950 [Gymnothorax javanicus]
MLISGPCSTTAPIPTSRCAIIAAYTTTAQSYAAPCGSSQLQGACPVGGPQDSIQRVSVAGQQQVFDSERRSLWLWRCCFLHEESRFPAICPQTHTRLSLTENTSQKNSPNASKLTFSDQAIHLCHLYDVKNKALLFHESCTKNNIKNNSTRGTQRVQTSTKAAQSKSC